jgi:predicted nucleic acid-binding protein
VTYLLDVNTLIALGFQEHEFHERVAAWVSGLDPSLVLVSCPITELGFVRVLQQAPQYRVPISESRKLLGQLRKNPSRALGFIPDDHGVEILPAWVANGRQSTDGYLSALARKHQAVLATLDEGIKGAFVIPEA